MTEQYIMVIDTENRDLTLKPGFQGNSIGNFPADLPRKHVHTLNELETFLNSDMAGCRGFVIGEGVRLENGELLEAVDILGQKLCWSYIATCLPIIFPNPDYAWLPPREDAPEGEPMNAFQMTRYWNACLHGAKESKRMRY